MKTTIVSMVMQEIAHCKMGLFSELRCGDKKLYTLEPPWDEHYPQTSCIEGGSYQVARVVEMDGESSWMMINVPNKAGVVIKEGTHVGDTNGDILIGNELGVFERMWGLSDSELGIHILNNWLESMHHFTLRIERRSAPMKQQRL